MRILRYLKKCPAKGMMYKRQSDSNLLQFQGFIDSDWAGSSYDKRSTSG